MSEPSVDFTGAIAAAMQMAFAGDNTASHPEYRVAPQGDPSPTSGATLDDVMGAASVDPPGPAPADGSLGVLVDPADVSTMGGSPNQWWTTPEDNVQTQAMADAINTGGVPGDSTPGFDSAVWQPFPPGPEGMVTQ
jgi:hypothetical protein